MCSARLLATAEETSCWRALRARLVHCYVSSIRKTTFSASPMARLHRLPGSRDLDLILKR